MPSVLVGKHTPQARRRYGGGVFDPFSLSPLIAARPESRALNDGDAISAWTNEGSVGSSLSQGTSGRRPLHKTNIQNGLAGVLMDGTDDYLALLAGSDWLTTTTLTAYLVTKKVANKADCGLMSLYANGAPHDYSAVDGALIGYEGSAGNSALVDYRNGSTQSLNSTEIGTSAHQTTHVFDGAGETMYFDGVAQTTTTTTGSFAIRNLSIGARWASSAFGNYSNRYYFELWIFAAAHDATNRGLMQSYLKAKWATP